MTRFAGLLATAALFAGAAPALAAPIAATPVAEGRVLILRPLSFVRLTDLDFGTVVSSNTAGTVTINPTTGARSIAGGLTAMPIAPGGRGYFAGAGSASQLVNIDLTPATVLTNTVTTDTIAVAAMYIEGSTTRTIDPTTLTFYVGVGGTILVGANQPDGDYESTFLITADYQ
jgi:hypothetical protein